MKAPWQTLWNRWLARRTPRTQRVTFTQRNVYIVPSMGGLVYALVVLILLVAAINEQLNLAYALAFLLGGVGLSSMSLTHGNLRGLSLVLGPTRSVHAGQTLLVHVTLDATGLRKGRFGLRLNGQLPCEVRAGEQASVDLPIKAQQRGLMLLPRIAIETTYPLGLFRAWGYWRAAPAILVWPALEPLAPAMPGTSLGGDADQQHRMLSASPEIPEEVREWQRGDAMRQILWKKSATRMASGLPPVVRHQAAEEVRSDWIDWDMTQGLDTEARLSRLATWLIRAEMASAGGASAYGLKLPGVVIPCSHGAPHLVRCLDALATWTMERAA